MLDFYVCAQLSITKAFNAIPGATRTLGVRNPGDGLRVYLLNEFEDMSRVTSAWALGPSPVQVVLRDGPCVL